MARKGEDKGGAADGPQEPREAPEKGYVVLCYEAGRDRWEEVGLVPAANRAQAYRQAKTTYGQTFASHGSGGVSVQLVPAKHWRPVHVKPKPLQPDFEVEGL